MRIPANFALCLFGGLIVSLAGCGEATSTAGAGGDDHAHHDDHDHDGHDHDHEGHDHDGHHHHDHGERPQSFSEAVEQLVVTRDAIRDAILNGDPDDAHDPLHEVGALIETIPDLAAETDLPEAEWTAVKEANEKLYDAFGKVDKAFHTKDGDKKAAYEGAAEAIDAAIEDIRSRLPPAADEAASADDAGSEDAVEQNADDAADAGDRQ